MAEGLNSPFFKEAKRYIPGGVNSPVRSFKAVGGDPVFIKSAKGSKLYSEDGREFIDYCQSFGALILGHAHPKIIQEIMKAVDRGTSFAAATINETKLAKLIVGAIPSIEKLRLTNSGTEAVMTALRLSRAFTQRNKILRFRDSYHGHIDYLLNCQGVPEDFGKYTLTSTYNNIGEAKRIVEENKADLAAIIIEPVAANKGITLPKEGFLAVLQNLAHEHNLVLIFDEVITGFRLSFGGAQKLFNIKPDLTCLGKIIGGGLPIGAVGGRKEILDLLAPEGPVYQAGTFSGNPISVCAGLATLETLSELRPYENLEKTNTHFCKKIKEMAEKQGLKVKINFISSMFSIDIDANIDTNLFGSFYHTLLDEGIYFSPSMFETNFLTTGHSERDIERTLSAAGKAFKKLRRN